jgi:hypothetical protein
MKKFTFSLDINHSGPDLVTVEIDMPRKLVRIHREARDIETAWELTSDKWESFLERIGEGDAPSFIDGVRATVEAGNGAEILRATNEIATRVFAEVDWDSLNTSTD